MQGRIRCSPSLRWVTRATTMAALLPTAGSFLLPAWKPVSQRSFSLLAVANADLQFGSEFKPIESYDSTLVIGRKSSIEQALPKLLADLGLEEGIPEAVRKSMVQSLDNKKGGSTSTLVPVVTGEEESKVHKLSVASLPTKLSRNNHPMAVHTLSNLAGSNSKGHTRVIVCNDDQYNVAPLASAIAKAFPLFSRKTSGSGKQNTIDVAFCRNDGSLITDADQLQAAKAVSTNVRLAARFMDSHPELLTTTAFAKEVREIIERDFPDKVTMTEIVGKDLESKGYGGLYNVGKAASCPPRMVILEYNGEDSDETVALVGKGIVYDTGGLSLKPKTGMCGMKHDMGGAAGLVGGFLAAVEVGVKKKLTCILCLAENAIGPDAFRNDDIITFYSGKTAEINNCDAEGRLVLADGVAHATKHIEGLDLVVDMATLTGAQMVATGKKHAGVLCNKADLEQRAVEAGLHSGDLCFPLLYAPEMLMDEFKSEVADMKNSVKDRGNAQTSCAGHFIEAHLDESYEGGWIHVDMAGPGSKGERGTGYGVGLVLSLLDAPGF